MGKKRGKQTREFNLILYDSNRDSRYVSNYYVSANGSHDPKIIREFKFRLIEASKSFEFWTAVRFKDIRKAYLISNLGRCFSLDKGSLITKQVFKNTESYQLYKNEYGWKTKTLTKNRNKRTNISILKLVFFHFNEISEEIFNNYQQYKVVNVKGKLNDFNLEEMVLLENYENKSEINFQTIRNIRKEYQNKKELKITNKDIAKKYFISSSQLERIVYNKIWRQVLI